MHLKLQHSQRGTSVSMMKPCKDSDESLNASDKEVDELIMRSGIFGRSMCHYEKYAHYADIAHDRDARYVVNEEAIWMFDIVDYEEYSPSLGLSTSVAAMLEGDPLRLDWVVPGYADEALR